MKKLLVLVGLSLIVVLMFASEASASCAILSASTSGSASASECNDTFTVSGRSASVPAGLLSGTPGLPGSGGFSPVLALGSLVLIVGSGLLALNIVRRR